MIYNRLMLDAFLQGIPETVYIHDQPIYNAYLDLTVVW